jgi:hypothetical protein
MTWIPEEKKEREFQKKHFREAVLILDNDKIMMMFKPEQDIDLLL